MSYKAQASTDESGRILTLVSIASSNININDNKIDHLQKKISWARNIEVFGDLLSSPKYSFLAQHILRLINPNLRAECNIVRAGRAISIRINNKIYKSCG